MRPEGLHRVTRELDASLRYMHTLIPYKMKIQLLIYGLLLSLFTAHAADNKKTRWHTYLAMYNTTAVAEAENNVYAVADGTLYSYGKTDDHIRVYSRQTGLSDSDVQLIRYSASTRTLLIAYANGNIDLMTADGVYNLPFLKNSTNIQDKTLNAIDIDGDRAYLSANFGLLVVDLRKREIAATYRLDRRTAASCLLGGSIYAATDSGLLAAATTDNLMDAANWKRITLTSLDFDDQKIVGLGAFRDRLCFCASGGGLFYRDTDGSVKMLRKQANLSGLVVAGNRLLAYAPEALYVFASLDGSGEIVAPGTVNAITALKEDNRYWIASGRNGLVGLHRRADGQYEKTISGLKIEGPKRNYDDYMIVDRGRLWVVGGSYTNTARGNRVGTLMSCVNKKWTNFDEETVTRAANYGVQDYVGIAIDPDDPAHCFVGTFGEGVIEIKDNSYVRLYNHTNTPLSSALPKNNDAQRYVRVIGIGFDKNKNLWMTNCSAQNGIVVRTPDGTWKSLYYKGVDNKTFVGRILFTSRGQKWVNVPRDGGLLVFDDNGTPTDGSDDKSHFFSSFSNASGTSLDVSEYYCLAEDRKGDIWVGTNHGPIVCSSAINALRDPARCYWNGIIRNDEDGRPRYFLDSEQINAIAVDGGNRKWIGTAGSGVYLVNADGTETLEHFTTTNSPLLSDNIRCLAIDNASGEVFIGTDKGLVSYRGDATEAPKTYSDVYAYPNPVRPDYDGSVTITGLIADSNVKITDLNGNLIRQGRSAGGQFTWDCRGANGQPVSSGVYLVLASTPDGSQGVVTKIAVVR